MDTKVNARFNLMLFRKRSCVTGEHGERVAERRQLFADVDVQMDVDAFHLPRHVQEPLGIF